MFQLLTVVGARPQFIKAAAISHAISQSHPARIAEDILHTGQHYDDAMSARFFRELDIPTPCANLGLGGGRPGEQLADMIKGIEQRLCDKQYDGLLVYGDTTSTLAAALAAKAQGVPLFHVEAGLRSHNRTMPEELNRILTDHIATRCFAPTPTAVANLMHEGVDPAAIHNVGDVMLDNALRFAPQATFRPVPEPYMLATIHRNFNTDHPERLALLLNALAHTGRELGLRVVMPLHPRTAKVIDSMNIDTSGLQIVQPFSYLETLGALRHAALVATDSGGLQKEAAFCHCPCLVLRAETEWIELVECGAAALVDDNPALMLQAARRMAGTHVDAPSAFGNGTAARQIAALIAP